MAFLSLRRALGLGLLIGVACGPSAAVHAEAMIRSTLPELLAGGQLTYTTLTQQADIVVSGIITEMSSYEQNLESARTITTAVTLRTTKRLKGTIAPTLVFKVPGGTVGKSFLSVSHCPTFHLGDEVLLFLRIYQDGSMYLPGDIVLLGDEIGVYFLSRATPTEAAKAADLLRHIEAVLSGRPEPPRFLGTGVSSGGEMLSRTAAKPMTSRTTDVTVSSVSGVRLDWDPNHPYHPLSDTLVITGSNFDSTPTANHKVEFTVWENSGQLGTRTYAGTDANILSWANTQIKVKLTEPCNPSCLSITSGNLRVYTPTGGWSNTCVYDIKFNTNDDHRYWSNTAAANGIPYKLNYSTNGLTGPTGTVSDVMWTGEDWHWADTLGVDKGYKVWQDVTYSNLNVTDGGNVTTPFRLWNDKVNVVVWERANASWGAYTYWSGQNDTLYDCDIVFNWRKCDGSCDTLFWSTKAGAVGSGGGAPPTDTAHPWRQDPKDVWDVMSHEAGHCFGINHAYGVGTADTNKTMYYTSSRRETRRRDLTSDDAEGVKWLYPSGSPKTPTGLIGTGMQPHKLYLRPNYPNPFNPQTSIAFYLEEAKAVTVEIYDVTGQRVISLMRRREMAAGDHQILWGGIDESGAPVSSGVYLCKLTAGSERVTQRMTLLR